MPYCERCGKVIPEDATYCPECGAPVEALGDRYYRRSPRRGFGVERIMALFFGFILLAVSFGLLVGGGSIMWVNGRLRDADGFLMSHEADFQVDSYALVQRGLDIDVDVNIPPQLWTPNPGDWVTLRLVATSNDPSKEVFIGVALEANAEVYLGDAEFDEIAGFSWSYNPWRESQPDVSYSTHPGSAPAGPPVVHSFWVAHATGAGTQTLEWEPEYGDYWVVVMNADGSADVDVEAQLGARIPILRNIGNGLFLGGLVLLFIGGYIFLRGLFPR
jgi:hypothetical protein